MENPNDWNEIQKTIGDALQEHHRQMASDEIGNFSDVTVIYNALVAKGFIIPPGTTPAERWGSDVERLQKVILMFEGLNKSSNDQLAEARWLLQEYRRDCPAELTKKVEDRVYKKLDDLRGGKFAGVKSEEEIC